MSVLYLNEYGTTLGVVNERVQVRRKGKVVQEIPVLHLERIVLMTPANITLPAVRLLMERGIDIAYLSPNGTYYGQFTRGDGKFVEQRLAQFRKFHEAQFRLEQAKSFITGKLQNMIAFWRRQRLASESKKSLEALPRILADLAAASSLESLLGYEGSATAVHFRVLREAVPESWHFHQRLHHPSPDPVNAMLSLGYTLLYSRMAGLLQMHGLDPYLGFFHEPKHGHASLASDMIEEWRCPMVDALVLKLINTKQLAPGDFHKSAGECRMNRPALQKFIKAFEQRMEQIKTLSADHGVDDMVGGLEGQVRQLIRVLLDKQKNYVPVSI